MSWILISGTIEASPMGRTQAEKRYILDTVLEHLPQAVTSEWDMGVYVVQPRGHNSNSSCDEFGMSTNNLISFIGDNIYRGRDGSMYTQDNYILVVNSAFRDVPIDQAHKDFQRWLCRLAKRVWVNDILIKVESRERKILIDSYEPYWNMFEKPSRTGKDEPNWCEYLMWEEAIGSSLPMQLEYKYYNNEANDKEIERRREARRI